MGDSLMAYALPPYLNTLTEDKEVREDLDPILTP